MKELIAIQSELKAPKNQFNNFGKYKYRSCEDILEAVKPLLVKHNCLLTISDDIQLVGDRFYIVASATLTSSTSTITIKAHAREDAEQKGMSGAQITGSASSYARKYALNVLFCIDDTKDDDTKEQKPKTQPKATATPKTQPKATATVNTSNAPVEDDLLIAIDDISRCTTVKGLSDEYKKWERFQNTELFINTIKIRREQLTAK